jgi:hypothetical protein
MFFPSQPSLFVISVISAVGSTPVFNHKERKEHIRTQAIEILQLLIPVRRCGRLAARDECRSSSRTFHRLESRVYAVRNRGTA